MNDRPAVLPGQPRNDQGPVFRAPWEAQAFATVVALHRQGLFTWPEWTRVLSGQIAKAQAAGDPDRGDTYYHHWLAALESLVAAKGASSETELIRYRRAWTAAAIRTPHGQPIELRCEDFER
ncbi:MAG: nitrile hydratase accessory protein [Burkholderiaceae bacterium]|nr:nitrile hydratase accessory protein [Burkholderiaceae bacterium]